jgi:hypothetical protein
MFSNQSFKLTEFEIEFNFKDLNIRLHLKILNSFLKVGIAHSQGSGIGRGYFN